MPGRPPHASIEQIVERAGRIARDVAKRRDDFHIETPWTSLTRLSHDVLGGSFDVPLEDLELPFWNAAAVMRPMPGAREALAQLHAAGVPLGVVGNSSFRQHVIRHELEKHGLAEHLSVIVVSAEYAVRKPNPLLFEVAAARLGIPCQDICFVAKAAGMTPIHFGPAKWPDIVRLLVPRV